MEMKTMSGRMILVVAAGLVVLIFAAGGIKKAINGHPEIQFKQNMLESLWFHYKGDNLEPGSFRTLDKERDNITTSEGESYTMLRAVWMDDKETFDRSWQWSKDNIQHTHDHLLSWLYGQRSDGTYGVLTEQGGQHSATDADTDVALALLFASKRWNDNRYFGDAIGIIRDIWDKEVFDASGTPYLLANDIEKADKTKDYYITNPSYFAPYAYRIFATVDPDHNWLGLADSSYKIIEANLSSALDKDHSASIPSDWVAVNKTTGAVSAVPGSTTQTSDFGYDALRIPWRLALDAEWFNNPQAKISLSEMGFLASEWRSKGKLYTHYAHNSLPVETNESAAMYGGTIGYFIYTSPTLAQEIYHNKLEALYNPDTFNWKTPLDYYDSNWAWFGIALYNHALPNLYSPDLYSRQSNAQ